MDTKMKETKLLGSLMPSYPDLIPILQNFKEKYNIPELTFGHKFGQRSGNLLYW